MIWRFIMCVLAAIYAKSLIFNLIWDVPVPRLVANMSLIGVLGYMFIEFYMYLHIEHIIKNWNQKK